MARGAGKLSKGASFKAVAGCGPMRHCIRLAGKVRWFAFMTLISQHIDLPVTPAEAYDYVSRPLRWKEWHASSLAVQEIGDESLVAGRRFEEDVRAAGRLRHLTWLVEESRPGERWRASAYMDDGSTVRLCYAFEPAPGGTRFTRTLDYVLAPRLLRLLNDLFLWRRVAAESARALARLQARLSRAEG